MTLKGAPQRLDTVLRPLVRAVQVVFGLTATAVLFFMGWYMLAPVPLALSFVAYEALFWIRADRPVVVRLDDAVTVTDPKRKQTFSVDLSTIQAATAQRRVRDGVADIRLTLATADAVVLGLWLRVPERTGALPYEVHADLFDHIVGGDHGSLRAIAPGDRIARQRIDTHADAIDWFREHVPEQAWSRTVCRVWHGVAPDLDLLGHHTGNPDGLWIFDPDSVHIEGHPHPLEVSAVHRSVRTAILLHAGRGLDDTFAEDRLQLAVLDIAGRALAAPSRILFTDDPVRPTDAHHAHTHSAELAAVVSHLFQHREESALPPSLVEAYTLARRIMRNTTLDG